MKKLKEIIGKMEAPLMFASENAYEHLPLVKNLAPFLISCIEAIRQTFNLHPGPGKKEIDLLLRQMQLRFEGFDGAEAEQKRERLAAVLKDLARLKEMLESSPEAIQNKKKERLAMPVRTIYGVGPRIAQLLAGKGLHTIEDLLYFLPRGYEDRRQVCRISETVVGVRQTVVGKISQAQIRYYGRRKVFEITLSDGKDVLKVKWFHGREAFLRTLFKPHRPIIVTGKISGSPFEREMIHPDFEILDDGDDQLLHFKRIVPLYSETEGLNQKTLRRILWGVVRDHARLLESPVPAEISQPYGSISLAEALHQVHFPDAYQNVISYQERLSDAHRRIIHDEFFYFQLGMAIRRHGVFLEKGIALKPEGAKLNTFYASLPFTLTEAQERVISEIHQDMAMDHSMNRLLQGDVGSGKTIAAMAAMIVACENGCQAAMMAPTEILAQQHFRSVNQWSKFVGLESELITGSRNSVEKRACIEKIRNGELNIVIGTHALIEEGILFRNLGLVVIDEQHRFGVLQRSQLKQKGNMPHMLVMTATPIPRTLAMTTYGDLDISVIDELPPGKKQIKTKVFYEHQRDRVYEIIRKEVGKGHQAFIVYPLATESDNLDLRDATRMSEHLQKDIFPDLCVGLIHGRMKSDEKESIMLSFSDKEIHILVATTVIEVGIDVPRASLMVIEHAERFGLSQLHQLRGRVGRSDISSYCILMTSPGGSMDARRRLRIMEETNDGFRIAEEDLLIRGPGEFMGTKQWGLPDFRVANIARDSDVLTHARADAFAIAAKDPLLDKPEHRSLREELLRRWGGRFTLMKSG